LSETRALILALRDAISSARTLRAQQKPTPVIGFLGGGVSPDPFFISRREQLVAPAASHLVPAFRRSISFANSPQPAA